MRHHGLHAERDTIRTAFANVVSIAISKIEGMFSAPGRGIKTETSPQLGNANFRTFAGIGLGGFRNKMESVSD
jgi:hypothetical protein